MKAKFTIFGFIIVIAVFLAGTLLAVKNRDREVTDYIDDINQVTEQIVNAVENPAPDVDELNKIRIGQKILADRKSGLMSKLANLKVSGQVPVHSSTKTALTDCLEGNTKRILDLHDKKIDTIVTSLTDFENAKTKFEKSGKGLEDLEKKVADLKRKKEVLAEIKTLVGSYHEVLQ